MTPSDLTVAIPTAGRPEMCRRALESVRRLEHTSGLVIDVIVVEQNDVPDYEIPEWFTGIWLTTARRSASHARNIALERTRSSTVLFLDDDAELGDDIGALVGHHRTAGAVVTCGQVRFEGGPTSKRRTRAATIRSTNLFHYFFESATLWDVAALRDVGGFDERMGVPLPLGAEEGALAVGQLAASVGGPMRFVPLHAASHPSVSTPPSEKAARYGAGAGALCWLLPTAWTFRYMLTMAVRRSLGLVVATITNDRDMRRVRAHWLRGFVRGLLVGRRERSEDARHRQITEMR